MPDCPQCGDTGLIDLGQPGLDFCGCPLAIKMCWEAHLKDLEADALHWEDLATQAETTAAYERTIGLDLSTPGSSVGDNKARTYRATAQALRLEAQTGIPHCSCHLLPNTKWADLHRGVRP